MEKLVANLSNNVKVKQLHGREYLVAPVVMMVEGVLAGNQGPILYEETEILHSVEAWNHKPITLGHPEAPDGTKLSGCAPEALERFGVGMILNAKYDKRTKKLKAEAWFDRQRLESVPDAYPVKMALNSGQKMEVSTGLFVDLVMNQGSFNGRNYVAKTKGYRPDHLAIILNGTGACSIADGAGLLVNKSTQITAKSLEIGSAWDIGVVHDIVGDQVVFAANEKFYTQNYAKDGETVKLLGNLIEVTRKVTYEPLVVNEKPKMERDQLLQLMGDEHKEFVANMSDEQVSALLKIKAEVAPAATPEPVAAPATVEPVVNETQTEKAPEPAPAPVILAINSLSELSQHVPEHLRSGLEQALATNQRVRDDLVAKIVANKANAFTVDELHAFPTDQLTKLASLASVALATNAATPAPLFAGSPGAPAPVKQAGLLPPSTFS